MLLDGCSIEHVMPQNIEDSDVDGRAWIAVLGESWRRIHAEWLHTPGNLTLVGSDYNREMSNRALVSGKRRLNLPEQLKLQELPRQIPA